MAADRERIFSRPDCPDHFHARILTMGMDTDQAPPGPKRPCQGRNDPFCPKIDRGQGAVWLGCNNEVEIGLGLPRPWNGGIQQEPVVLAIEHEHDGPLVERHGGAWADRGAPVLFEEWPELGDLLLELARRGAPQRNLVPDG